MTGSLWALVAIKARADCKGRLAVHLAPVVRLALVRLMLERVLGALADAQVIDRIAVVTPEPDWLPPNVLVLPDPGRGLNAALEAGRDTLVKMGARELVVLPADLPLVSVADIDLLVACGRKTGFALASDVERVGTNALYLAPPAPFCFHFGCASRFRHLAEAAQLGLTPGIVQAPGLVSDLDNVEDLMRLGSADAALISNQSSLAAGDAWLPKTRCG